MKRQKFLAWLLVGMLCMCNVNVPVYAADVVTEPVEVTEPAEVTEPIEVVKQVEVEDPAVVEKQAIAEEQVVDESCKSTWDGVTKESVYEDLNYKVTFKLGDCWPGGYNASVRIDNTSGSIIDDWCIEMPMGNEVANIWNASICDYTDDIYKIKNVDWNQDIAIGGFVEYGFSGKGDFLGFPGTYKMLGESLQSNNEDYSVEYKLSSDWESGFSGEITINNKSEQAIEDWILEFDFDRNLTSIWNGVILSHEDNHYVIKNAGYNANVVSGQAISFGFNGQDGQKDSVPTNYVLHQFGINEDDNNLNWNEDYLIVQNALSQLSIGYAFGDTEDSVTSNLNLCTEIEGASVQWVSSNHEVISNSGVVNRPSNSSVDAILTAKVSSNEYYEERVFQICVIKNTYVDYNLNYIEDLDSLEMLYLYNDGNPEDLEVYLSEQGYISFISGSFSDFVVESPEEAVLSLYGIKSLMGCTSPKDELRWLSTTKDEYGTSFRFEQIYHGIPIYGNSIVVSVDSEGRTSSLQSSFSSDIDINIEPTVSEENAKNNLISNGLNPIETKGLYILVDGSQPKLVWNIVAVDETNIYNILIDAYNGDLLLKNLQSNSNSKTGNTTGSGTSYLGSEETFSVVYEKKDSRTSYILKDAIRNISIYDAYGLTLEAELPGELVIKNDNDSWTPSEVSAIANVSKAYDYFNKNYRRKGMDGQNSPIAVSIGFAVPNSYSLPGSLLVFGQGGYYRYGIQAALDVVGHEYTHGVIGDVTSLINYSRNAAGAINEGYADIFGYFIEGDNDNKWLHGEDNMAEGKAERNISNPAESIEKQPSKIGDLYYYDFEGIDPTEKNDFGEIHKNSSIISHCCYQMWKGGMKNKHHLADLWYHSLLLGYDKNSSFDSVRSNVLRAAKDMKMTPEEVQIIKEAFDTVGIKGKSNAVISRTNVLYGKVVIADLDMILGNNTSLSNAYVSLDRGGKEDFNVYAGRTNSDGTFCIPNIVPGTYKLLVSKDGYYTSTQMITLSSTKLDNYFSTIELIPITYIGKGIAKGRIVDSVTGNGVEGLTMYIREGANSKTGTIVGESTSHGDGTYETIQLESGHYCIEVIDKRTLNGGGKIYLRTFFNIKVLGGYITKNQNATVSTSLDSSQLRIVLEWGATPEDLDSHLVGPTPSGGTFHVYFMAKQYTLDNTLVADLDLDDTTSYGPETITIYDPVEGTYTYYVYNYSGYPEMKTSGACVKVYSGNYYEPACVFNIPIGTSGDYWTVFSFNSKTRKITPINVVSSSVAFN